MRWLVPIGDILVIVRPRIAIVIILWLIDGGDHLARARDLLPSQRRVAASAVELRRHLPRAPEQPIHLLGVLARPERELDQQRHARLAGGFIAVGFDIADLISEPFTLRSMKHDTEAQPAGADLGVALEGARFRFPLRIDHTISSDHLVRVHASPTVTHREEQPIEAALSIHVHGHLE